KDTVPFAPAVGGGIAVAVATILVVEALRLLCDQPAARGQLTDCLQRCLSERSAGFVSALLRALYAGVFGLLCTELVTVAGKLGFGRQRPHFLAVCQLLNASACRPGLLLSPLEACRAATVAPKALDEASMSFPSGHSSFSMFVAVFLALYLQARLGFRHPMHPVKNVCQLALLALAGFVCGSRVSDYHHHWSDVLAGASIGALFGFLMSLNFAVGLSIYRPLRLVDCDGVGGGASYELVGSADISKAGDDPSAAADADALP
uniref:AcidPPc domain-containing protein n=2 Tax=Macrostomum lignano TaxID=282301 RepID=A0A1I8GEY0_9PLAT